MSAKTNKLKRRVAEKEKLVARLREELAFKQRANADTQRELLLLKKEKERGFQKDGSIILTIRKDENTYSCGDPPYLVAMRISPEMIFRRFCRSPGQEVVSFLRIIAHDMEKKSFQAMLDYFEEKMGFKQKGR